ncbi:glycosyl hydrolase family 71-domain-containing protein [Apiospora phragmitis]|uniref:Glycosyl hydrolase family 71-domain-containing protein n=1 Tax=Apiospora phragmitis TaxID=2905665 RepID=A0ABR1X786_9PEZI
MDSRGLRLAAFGCLALLSPTCLAAPTLPELMGNGSLPFVGARGQPTRDPLNDMTSCSGLSGPDLKSDMYDEVLAYGSFNMWMSDWKKQNMGNDDATWLSDFWKPLGQQQSHLRCDLPQSGASSDCSAPNCDDLGPAKDAAESAWKYMVVLSAANIHIWLSRIYESSVIALDSFAANQVALAATFMPTKPDNTALNMIVWNAVGAGIGAIFDVAAGVTGNFAFGVVGRFVGMAPSDMIGVLASKDDLTSHVGSLEVDSVKSINKQLITGRGTWTPQKVEHASGDMIDVQNLFNHGYWVDANNIPVLKNNGPDLAAIMTQYLYAGVVNQGWMASNVYLACLDMTEQEFNDAKVNAGNNDKRLKVYYQGMGCYFQMNSPDKVGALTYSRVDNPPGFESLDWETYRFSTHDVMKSSIDAWQAGGFGYKIGQRQFEKKFSAGASVQDQNFSVKGLFTIPVCKPGYMEDRKKVNDYGLVGASLDGNDEKQIMPKSSFFKHLVPPGKRDWNNQVFCFCRNIKDQNGKTMQDFQGGHHFSSGWPCNEHER